MSIIRNTINRMRPGETIGLDYGGQKGRQRTINRDGSYNIERITGGSIRDFQLFHWLLTASWKHYWMAVLAFYGVMNIFFAILYYLLGPENIHGIPQGNAFVKFAYCFFFSAQSYTTVGYGALNPTSIATNLLATIEAFTGLMTFAIATGTLWGRFSKPVSKIKFSPNIIIAPFKDITALQFMVANQMDSTLMEMEARVNISWVEQQPNGEPLRKFQQLNLEFDKIAMFPTSWIINHPIDEESMLYGKTLQEIQQSDVEVFVLLKGFDDVFSQTIYVRSSYTSSQFVYGAKFSRPFYVRPDDGKLIMDLTKVGDYTSVPLQQ